MTESRSGLCTSCREAFYLETVTVDCNLAQSLDTVVDDRAVPPAVHKDIFPYPGDCKICFPLQLLIHIEGPVPPSFLKVQDKNVVEIFVVEVASEDQILAAILLG